MTELNQLLGNIEELGPEVADSIRNRLDDDLEVPEGVEVLDQEPEIASDDTGDWIVAQFQVGEDRLGQIYALAGAYTLQVYDGEDFLEPTTSLEELNQQLESI